jgi:hypothetical protein
MVEATSFRFERGNIKTYEITDDFRIRLTQIGAQLATLQLVDQNQHVIPYPQGFIFMKMYKWQSFCYYLECKLYCIRKYTSC